MDIQLKIDENSILHYIEDYGTDADTEMPNYYMLSFSFYDCSYFVSISKENIEKDERYELGIDGDTKLGDSFRSFCENEAWEIIKKKCKEYDEWYSINIL